MTQIIISRRDAKASGLLMRLQATVTRPTNRKQRVAKFAPEPEEDEYVDPDALTTQPLMSSITCHDIEAPIERAKEIVRVPPRSRKTQEWIKAIADQAPAARRVSQIVERLGTHAPVIDGKKIIEYREVGFDSRKTDTWMCPDRPIETRGVEIVTSAICGDPKPGFIRAEQRKDEGKGGRYDGRE